jgi:hypothetical protein
VFLVGGPAYSGTTLLALLLNQGDVVCLDEPDFHTPAQSHRGIPFLQELFPDRAFPARPTKPLSYEQAVALMRRCERAIAPYELGMKTCDTPLLGYAKVFRRLGCPIVWIFRDIRDALVRPLEEWVTEKSLNGAYRDLWQQRSLADLVLRYEDLVADPAAALAGISSVLGRPLETVREWAPEHVHEPMLKDERHQLLRSGSISRSRVGIWRTSGRSFTPETLETARLMGY